MQIWFGGMVLQTALTFKLAGFTERVPKMEFSDLAKLKISIVNFSFKPAG